MYQHSTTVGTVEGLLTLRHGTLRILRNRQGRIYVEVIGFETDEGRTILSDVAGQLEDIVSEILVCDDPEAYGAPVMPRRLHHRRGA